MPLPMVQLDHVSFTYAPPTSEAKSSLPEDTQLQPVPALNDVSLTIQPGEFVAIIGHNGSGKSTLAKHLNALYIPDSGFVMINGLDTSISENVWTIRQNAGMVFQNPDNQLVANVVEEDVAFGPENIGVPSDEIRRRVDDALAAVDMTDHALRSPAMLSGGQKQRVAIAGIIAMRPALIILDEPTAMLDPVGRREVMDAILRLNQEGLTVVHITHFMEEAVLAKRVVAMEDGRIILDGTPREVFSHVQLLQSVGLDVPAMTELAGLLELPIPRDIMTVAEMAGALAPLLGGEGL